MNKLNKKTYKYNIVNNLKLLKFLCVMSFGFFIVGLCFQVYVSNSTALKGKDFKNCVEQKLELEKEIAILKYEDSNLSSLEYVEESAIAMGFMTLTDSLLPIVPPSLAALSTP